MPRRRINVRGPVTLLFLIVVLASASWFGWKTVVSDATEQLPPGCATPTPGTTQQAVAGEVTVNVYNAGTVEGLATRTAHALEKRGFRIGTVANIGPFSGVSDVHRAAVIGRDKTAPEVALVAAQVNKPTVQGDDRTDRSVDLVVGSRFAGLRKKAPTSVRVQSTAPVCPSSSPSPKSGSQL